MDPMQEVLWALQQELHEIKSALRQIADAFQQKPREPEMQPRVEVADD